MTEHDYLLGWSAYAVAALGCLLVWFQLTSWMWRYLREPLRVLVAVLLLTPTIIDPVKELYAPAIAITALDLVFKVGNNVWRAVSDLAMYGMIVAGLYLLFVAIRWPLERRWQARRPAPVAADEPTLRQIMDEQTPEAARDDEAENWRDDRRQRIEPRL